MIKKFTYLIWLAFLLGTRVVYGQICATPGFDGSFDIGGQVNTYYPPAANTILTGGSTSVVLAKVPDDVNFGGGVNTYSPSVNGQKLQIRIGDLLLIIQMQNATIESANSALYGAGTSTSGPDRLGGTGYTSLGNTGLFEYVVATSDVPITGGVLTFRGAGPGNGIVNTYFNTDYDPASTTRGQRTFQVVRVPQYSNVKLTATISAPPFNGQVGGIIAFDVAGTMNFNGQTIDASARGFRGGFTFQVADPNIHGGYYVGPSTDPDLTGMGEGIVGSSKNMWDGFLQVTSTLEGLPNGSAGRGAPGNGGGGGGAHNTGGGGGGNGGYGGVGGNACCTSGIVNGGRPGSITYLSSIPTPTRLIMGGGGGAGQVDNAPKGNSGGVGGGIVLLNVGQLTSTGTITVNGSPGQDAGWCALSPYNNNACVTNDGGAGGGAGGTIFLKVSNVNSTAGITLSARGGKGGNTACYGCPDHGPGGGGGGGLVFYSNNAVGTINSNSSGGAAGVVLSRGNSTFGASSGGTGQALTFTISSLPLHLQGGGVVCFPELSTSVIESRGGVGARMPGASVTYTVTVSNTKPGVGNSAGTIVDLSLPVGISYQSVRVAYTGGTGGDPSLSVTTNQNTSASATTRPRFGNFVVAPGGSVILTVLAKVDCNAITGTYGNVSAQVYYFDPTRSSTTTIQRISPSPAVFSFPTLSQGPISTSYTSGGAVPGVNYNGLSSSGENVEVTDGIPVLSSSLTPSRIQSGSIFSYTPTSGFVFPVGGGDELTYSWSRGAITGINNGLGASGNYAISEALINTSSVTISVPYVYTLRINGCIKSSQTVTVGVNPSVLSMSAFPNPVNGGNTSTVWVSLPNGVLAASTITLSLLRTSSGTALSGTHYEDGSVPNSVSIPMGQNSISFTIRTLSTNMVGLVTTLGLSSSLSNYTISGVTLTIIGATSTSIISISSGSVVEGLSRTLLASLPSGVSTSGALTLSISSSPIFPLSYSITPSLVVIPAGGQSVSFTVNTARDGFIGDNSFSIVGSAPGLTSIPGTLLVSDVDASLGSTTLSVSSGSVTEGLSRSLRVSLPMNVKTNTALTVTLGVNGFPSSYSISPSVVIAAGETSATFVVWTGDDGNIGDQSFSITCTASVPNLVTVPGTLTVLDSSAMSITIESGLVTETLSRALRVSLPPGVRTTTGLTIQLGHSTFPNGYSISPSVVIQAGQNSANFVVGTVSDGNVGNNTFSITGSVSGGNFTVIGGTLVVEDVDVRGGLGGNGSTNLTIDSGSVTESLAKSLRVSLPMNVKTNTALTVTLGHRVFPSGGYSISPSVVIQSGENSATFLVQTSRDGNVGNNELGITGTVNAVGSIRATDFTVSEGILTVLDVDVRGGLTGTGSTSITISSGVVSETLTAVLTVSLPMNVKTNTPLTITLGHSALPNLNYEIPSYVVIGAGQNTATIEIKTVSDGNVGDNELSITSSVSLPDYAMVGGVLVVEDVDVRGGLYSNDKTTLSISSDIVMEGLSSTLSVSLPIGVKTNTALTVSLSHSNFPVVGYSVSPSVVIHAGDNSANFVVWTVPDSNIGDHVISITGSVSSNVLDYVVSVGTLSVVNTDSVSLTISSGYVTETLTSILRVSLPPSVITSTPLRVALDHSVFPNSIDYDIPPFVEIASGENSATFAVQTGRDGNVGNNLLSISGTVSGSNYRVIPGLLEIGDVDVRGGIGGTGSTTLSISSGIIGETQAIVLRVSLPLSVKTNTALTVTLGHSTFPSGGYTLPPYVVIQSGQNSATFVLQTGGDGNIGDNVVSITGSVSVPDFVISSGSVTVTDNGSTSILISSGSITESLSGIFTVSLAGGVRTTTGLTIQLGHSAIPIGYSISSSVEILAGESSATFMVQTVRDGNVGDNEFSITGTVVGKGFVVSPGSVVVRDVDVRGGIGGIGSTTLTISSAVIVEGSSGVLNVSLPTNVNTNVALRISIESDRLFLGGYSVNGGSLAGRTRFDLLIPAGSHGVSYTLQTALDGQITDAIFHLNGVSMAEYTYEIGTLSVSNSDSRQVPLIRITSSSYLPIGGSITASISTTASMSSGGLATYTIEGGSGSATLGSSTNVVSGLRAGNVVLRVSTSGDTNYSGVTSSQTITIGKGTPTLLLGASTSSVRVGEVLSLSATSVSLVGSVSSTGRISYRVLNTIGSGGATIDRLSGVLVGKAAGIVVVEAIQEGDSNYYSPLPASLTLTIGKGSQSLTISSVDVMDLGGSLRAIVSSSASTGRGGSLSYSIIPGTGRAVIDSQGVIVASVGGRVTLSVSISGDSDYESAIASQTITIASLSISTSTNSLLEGSSGVITLSLVPISVVLPRDISFRLGGSVLSSGRYSLPASVTLTGGLSSVSFSVGALSDKVLYNDEELELAVNNEYLNSLSTTLVIRDVTALNPANRVVTLGSGTLYYSGMLTLTCSLPAGITSIYPITVSLGVGSGSTFSLLASSPTVSSSVLIPVGSTTGYYTVEASSGSAQGALIVIEGSSVSMSIVQPGEVKVVNKKVDLEVAISNNGDGINDCMTISGINNYPNNTVIVVNKEGTIVYNKSSYSSGDCFAGRYSRGGVERDLSTGVYYYIIAIRYKDDQGVMKEDIVSGPLKIREPQ